MNRISFETRLVEAIVLVTSAGLIVFCCPSIHIFVRIVYALIMIVSYIALSVVEKKKCSYQIIYNKDLKDCQKIVNSCVENLKESNCDFEVIETERSFEIRVYGKR